MKKVVLPNGLFGTFLQTNASNFPITRKNKNLSYYNIPCSFDIETSSFYEDEEKRCTMYAWVFSFNGYLIRGRTWQEWIDVCNTLKSVLGLSTSKRLLIFIQNFSYEFQWFRHYFDWDKVFATDTRKPLYAVDKGGIEFRCSYLLSGYNLETMGKNLTKYKVEKLVGDLDYKKLRHCSTPLTDKEWGYIENDAVVVTSFIQEEIERLGSVAKFPLTKTGYVRNYCRERCLKGKERFSFVNTMKYLTLDRESYMQMRKTYMGGFSHANKNHVNRTRHQVSSYDFTSSYPAVMLSEKYPMSAPRKVTIKNITDFRTKLSVYCCMFECVFTNIKQKVDYENFISSSKCRILESPEINNGRVMSAKTLSIYLTEQDFFIISDMYTWEKMSVGNFYVMYKDYLPKPLIECTLDLYKDKTELKGVEDKISEYMTSKGMLNSEYGMCVTDVIRTLNEYDNGEWIEELPDIDAEIDKYNKNRNRFLYYPWGIWITAYARRNLFSGINEFKDDYIYSDTDSLKVLNADRHQDYFLQYNKRVIYKAEKCLKRYDLDIEKLRPKTIKGVSKPIGVWDFEGTYTRFKTLGAKRYIYEKDGDIEITIAGVNKKAGKTFLKTKYSNNTDIFRNFRENLEFPAYYERDGIWDNGSGKLCHTYIDEPMCGELTDYMGNTAEYHELSGIHMDNTSYVMSITDEFMKLIIGVRGGHINGNYLRGGYK